jgi:hypothetical protein
VKPIIYRKSASKAIEANTSATGLAHASEVQSHDGHLNNENNSGNLLKYVLPVATVAALGAGVGAAVVAGAFGMLV